MRVPGSTFIEIAEVYADPDGRLLYCTAVRGLQVADARNPAQIATRGHVLPSLSKSRFSGCQHLAVDGARAFVTNRGNGNLKTPFVTAVDIGDGQPTERAAFTRGDSSFEGIAARGTQVYVAMHDEGLLVLEYVDETFTEQAVVKASLRAAWDVVLEGDRLYVTDAAGALAIFDTAVPVPRLLGQVEVEGTAQAVAVLGQTAYIAAGSAGLVTVDVSNPRAPRVVSTLDTPGSAVEIAVAAGRVYLADWGTVRVYDVSNPHAPVVVAVERIETDKAFSRVLGVGAAGDHVFIGEWTGMYAYRFHPERQAPAMVIGASSLEFGAGVSRQTFEIENHGTAPLLIPSIRAEGQGFSTVTGSMLIEPGQLRLVTVEFASLQTEAVTGRLLIDSNDPDRATAELALSAGGDRLGIGAAAPPVEVELLEGGQWRLADAGGQVVLLAYFATF